MTARLEIAADLLSLRAIGPWLRDLLHGCLPDAEIEPFAARCELGVQEVAVNIVTHGYGDRADGSIDLDGVITDGTLRVRVTDDGAPYQPDDHADPDPDDPQIHGYGLMIVRQLTSEFTHRRDGDRNHTTLVFDLPPAIEPPLPASGAADHHQTDHRRTEQHPEE